MSCVKMINAVSGTPMTVPESRKEEYLAAGHKLAAEPKPEKPKTAAKKTKK